MRLIDADRLLKHTKFYNLPNGNRAIDEIDILHAPTIQAIPLDRVKQLRKEIDNLADDSIIWGILANTEDSDIDAITEKINDCYRAMILPFIDKLISESEG